MSDYQQKSLYKWEDKHIAPRDKSKVTLEIAPVIVHHIWTGEGLLYPPKVCPIPKQTRRYMGKANRERIWLKPVCPTWLIVHELAHSLNCTIGQQGDLHGPNYAGIYMRLLSKYLNIPLPLLMYTAKEENVDYNLSAQYLIVD